MSTRYKYPRTPHLPWSPGASADDVFLNDLVHFQGCPIVVTEKMDGENTTIYCDGIHARSLDSAHHPSRAWVKALQGHIGPLIPPGWRICGENLFARHSLAYSHLPSYFLMFSIWDEQNRCLSWKETQEWAELLEIKTVRVLYQGTFDTKILQQLCKGLDLQQQEGLVVRSEAGFLYDHFAQHVAKWVRAGHVTTDDHWMHRAVIPNELEVPDANTL